MQGGSTGIHAVELCANQICPSAHIPEQDQLNAAQSGAWVQNMPAQVDYIVQQMQANPKIDYKNDWKLVNLLIGANNLCWSCMNDFKVIDSADFFESNLTETMTLVCQISRVEARLTL